MKLKARVSLLACLLLLFSLASRAAAQECYSYEKDGVSLTGTISKKTFPGPPNYESIKNGDKPETYWILHLAKPICTTASADNDAESNVTDLQLILPAKNDARFKKDYARFRKLVGRSMDLVVLGRLTHAITGHHHTPVMMEVKAIAPHKLVQY
jgi:hypothetical protein